MSLDAWKNHERMLREDAEYRREYEALEGEFAVVEELIKARARAGLTQAQVAERLGISQPAIARIEGGRNLSVKTLERYAKATGGKLRITIESAT